FAITSIRLCDSRYPRLVSGSSPGHGTLEVVQSPRASVNRDDLLDSQAQRPDGLIKMLRILPRRSQSCLWNIEHIGFEQYLLFRKVRDNHFRAMRVRPDLVKLDRMQSILEHSFLRYGFNDR